jgi:hypothetical protein
LNRASKAVCPEKLTAQRMRQPEYVSQYASIERVYLLALYCQNNSNLRSAKDVADWRRLFVSDIAKTFPET